MIFFDLHAKVDKTNKKYKKHAKLFNHGAWRDHSGVRPGEIILERGLEGSFSVDHFVVGLGGIILGGLIQESETENLNKVPILGNIPLLGRLFRNKSTSTLKSELVVFVTPYVFYGNEEDDYRWNQLRDEMELSIDN